MINLVKRDVFHYKWSNNHKPVLYVKPGDKVRFETNEGSGQLTNDSTVSTLTELDASKFLPLAGPVYIEGAMPGDCLVIEVEDVKIADWGWTGIIPGYGLLEEFKKPYLHVWKLANKRYARFRENVRIPLRPFCGVMGVAPREDGFFDPLPPGKHGGNMDVRHLVAGTTVMLPIWVKGALFSVGDVHGAQGDGEVCISAIECPGEATLSFDLVRDAKIGTPRFLVSGQKPPKHGYVVTTGISPDLMDAAREAVRNMIDYLAKDYHFTREEAYILCSIAGDLRIHEIVDKPNWFVGMMISRDLFRENSRRK